VKRLLWIVGLPLLLAACGAPGGLYGSAPAASAAPSASTAPANTPSTTAPAATIAPTSAPATAAASVLATQNARLGTILTNPQGRTLYYFVPERGGNIVCSSSACTTYWPPSLSAGGNPTGSAGVTGQLGLVMRTGGGQQISYNNWPLYTFAGDSAAGQTNGQGVVGFGGKWLVATPGLQP
jgi:predicted lipoprotein with Yx(FWY)xxD motif